MTHLERAKKIGWRRLSLLMLLFSLVVITPRRASASVADLISFLQSIISTLQNDIGQTLSQIQHVETEVAQTRQQVVWPVTTIDQAKSFSSRMQAQYAPIFQSVRQLPIASATLQAPSNLERVLRSRSTVGLAQADQYFATVYSQPTAVTDAAPLERNLVDMDDALARSSIKQTIASDQNSEQILGMADSLEQRTAAAAPGSAVYLNVEAQLATLHSQAQSLKILAAELRVEAGSLAHENTFVKQRALNVQQLRNDLQNLGTRAK